MEKKLKGKESMRSIVERVLSKSLWEVFGSMTDCKTAEEAQIKLVSLSQGKILTTTQTIIKTIKNGVAFDEIKPDAHFLQWIPSEDLRRGKQSMQDIAEEHFGCSIWEVFTKHFQDIKDAESAAKRIVSLSKGHVTCSAQTIVSTIQRGVDGKKVSDSDFFTSWIPERKKKKVKVEKEKPAVEVIKQHSAYPVVSVSFVCDCGHKEKGTAELMFDVLVINLKGRRCSYCNKFGTFEANFVYKDKEYKKKIVDTDIFGHTVSFEQFVNNKGEIIEQP